MNNTKYWLFPISSNICSKFNEYYMREGDWNSKNDNCCDKYFIDFYYFFIPCTIIVDFVCIPYNVCNAKNKVGIGS